MATTAPATAQPDPQPQGQTQQPPDTHALTAAIVVVLLSGLPYAPMAGYLAALLAPLGVSTENAQIVTALVQPRLHPPAVKALGPAETLVNKTAAAYTAAYVLQAAQRLQAGGSVDQERIYLQQHLQARQARAAAAKQVDAAAAQHGPVLGWHAVMDSHTTTACRAAHGHNFHAAVPPTLGYPGTLHGGVCRCLAGPAFPGASSVDEVTSRLPAGTV